MAYSTRDDLETRLGTDGLTELTDRENLGEVNDARLTKAITDADALIDMYVGLRYTVPMSPVPTVVVGWSVALAVYYLYQFANVSAPEDVKKNFDATVTGLKDVAAGRATLGETAAPPTEAGGEVAATTARDKTFRDDEWGNF